MGDPYLGHLSVLYLVMRVPLLQLLDNLCITLNVLWIWFTPMHLSRTVYHPYKPQVLPTADWTVGSMVALQSPPHEHVAQ